MRRRDRKHGNEIRQLAGGWWEGIRCLNGSVVRYWGVSEEEVLHRLSVLTSSRPDHRERGPLTPRYW